MIKTIIIKNDQVACATLRTLVKDHFPELQLVGDSATVAGAVRLIRKEKPSLMFLDFRLKDGDAFELFKKIDTSQMKIILTTSDDNHAAKRLKCPADAYLKPSLTVASVKAALRKLNKWEFKIKVADLATLLRRITEEKPPEENTLVLKKNNNRIAVLVSEILYCVASDNYTEFYLLNGEKMMAPYTLKKYKTELAPFHFCDVHRSYLVNLQHVKFVSLDKVCVVEMIDGVRIIASAGKKKQVRNLFHEYKKIVLPKPKS